MANVDDFTIEGAFDTATTGQAAKHARRYGQVTWATIRAIDAAGSRHCAAFWALVILLGVRRELVLTYSRLREDEGWVRVSSALLPGHKHLPAHVKRDAVALLERAGLVEVRRSPHASPRVRPLRRSASGSSEAASS